MPPSEFIPRPPKSLSLCAPKSPRNSPTAPNGRIGEFSMRVRKAKQGDVTSVARVHVTAWRACYSGIMPKDFLDRLSPVERAEGWRTFLEKSGRTLLVCQSEGDIVGFFAACGRSRDQDKEASRVGEVYA